MKIRAAVIFCCFLILTGGCARAPREKAVVFSVGDVVERVGDCALLRTDASGFARLDQNARIAAYYLYRAVLAGKDIPRIQIEPRQAQGMRFMAQIGAHIRYGAPDYLVEPYRNFLKTVWINGGFYDLHTGRKLPASIGQREISQLMFVALSNSGGTLGDLTEINLQAATLLDTLFSAERYPTLFPAVDSSGNFLQEFPQSFYDGLSAAEAAGFRGHHPLNSNWLKKDGRIVETVYRTGDEELAPGPFAALLKQVIENLEKARPYLPADRIAAADDVIRYLRTGDPTALDSAGANQCGSRAAVDFVFGFTDTRFDPLQTKGLWTGMLCLLDSTAQGKLDQLYAALPNLLSAFPGASETKRDLRSVTAGQLLAATSPLFPLCPDGYQSPPGESGGETASRWIFTNILEARAVARAQTLEAAFCRDEEEREAAQLYSINTAFVRTALELMLGLPPQPPLGMDHQKEATEEDILRCAYADLAVLWLFREERLQKMGILPEARVADEAYRSYARRYLLEPVLKEMGAGRRRAVMLICNYLIERGGLKLEEDADGIYCRLPDASLMRDQVFELAGKLEALRRAGKPEALRDFIRRYATEPDPSLVEKAGNRLSKAGTFTTTAFILPLIQADFNPMGGIEKVYLRQPADLAEEMLIYEGVRQPAEKE
jgi:dipeptidyl-peptidase-3